MILVVGAGRGPLVACALSALQKSGRQAKVYAVDKNIRAFTTSVALRSPSHKLTSRLQERKAIEWGDAVDIIYGDMRTINVPEQADIMVSELLGSFGDNELSPECLDGAMRFLKRQCSIRASLGIRVDIQPKVYLYLSLTLLILPPSHRQSCTQT